MHPIMTKIQMKRKMSCIQKLMQISFNGNLPLQAAREFLGSSGPKHSLGPGTATPSIFFFFGLFIPMFFWVRFANHTNSKAEMVGRSRMDMCGSGKKLVVLKWKPGLIVFDFSCLPVKQIIGLKGVLLPMKQ